MVLSFSRAAEAMMFSVGWQAVEITTSAGGTQAAARSHDPRFSRAGGGVSAPTCVSLEFLDDLFGLKVPDVHHAVLGARHDPLQGRGQRLKAGSQSWSGPVSRRRGGGELVLTFPPVTEKLAKMQYFSFLWPVYVFKHWQRDSRH